jgi:hypothetical protein
VIPAGGLSADHQRWIHPRYPFFLPVKVLSRVFRGKYLAELKRLHRNGELFLAGPLKALADEKSFRQFLRTLHRQDWVVYAKPPFGGPQHILHYLARYTHRVAISNHRIVNFADGKVTFRWKDYAAKGKQRLMTLTAEEFLRRFLIHTLPRGFVRIRFFGFLANRRRSLLLPVCRRLLKETPRSLDHRSAAAPRDDLGVRACSQCGGPMILIERLTAYDLARESSRSSGVDTS